MKKNLLLIAVLIFCSIAVKSQNPVLNLSNYLRNGMLDKAYENLNIAMKDDRYTNDAKTWLLRGNFYYSVFRCFDFASNVQVGMPDSVIRYLKGEPLTDFKKQRTPEGRANKWEWDLGFSVLFIDGKVHSFTEPVNGAYKSMAESSENALTLAKESYQKTIELDPRFMGDMTFPLNAYQGLSIVSDGFTSIGASAFNDGNYPVAFKNFYSAHEIKNVIGIREAKDTVPGYWAVYSANFYVRMLSEKGDFEKALDVADKAKKISPDDVNIVLSEADAYLKMKNYIKTKELLENIIVKQPDNAQLYFVIGNIYDQLAKDSTHTPEVNEENFQLSIKYYKSAIEINNEYFDALFNLGTVYNNRAVDRLNEAMKKKYGDPLAEQLYSEADENFRIALPYLEQAYLSNPNDPDTLRMLFSIYTRLRINDKANEIKSKIDSLKN